MAGAAHGACTPHARRSGSSISGGAFPGDSAAAHLRASGGGAGGASGGAGRRAVTRLSLWPSPRGPVGRVTGAGPGRPGREGATRRRDRPWAAEGGPELVHLCIDATKNT